MQITAGSEPWTSVLQLHACLSVYIPLTSEELLQQVELNSAWLVCGVWAQDYSQDKGRWRIRATRLAHKEILRNR